MRAIVKALRRTAGPVAGLCAVMLAPAPAAGETKLPQLDIGSYASQVFWLVVSFIVLYVLVSRFAAPRISEVLEERQDRIADDLDKADGLRKEAEQVEAEYEQSLREARDKAHATVRAAQDEVAASAAEAEGAARGTMAGMLQEAEQRIDAARAEAVGNIRSVACDLAVEATARLAGLNVTADQAGQAVDQVMAERNQ